MGTRSTIAFADHEGNFRGCYIQYDGYPDGVGETLYKIYHAGRIEELRDLIKDNPQGGSSLILDDNKPLIDLYSDVPEEEKDNWGSKGVVKPMSNKGSYSPQVEVFGPDGNSYPEGFQEWNYIILPNYTMIILGYRCAIIDLKSDVKPHWEIMSEEEIWLNIQ